MLAQASRDDRGRSSRLAAALGGAINAYVDLMVAIPASLALCTVAAGLATTSPATVASTLRSSATMGVAVAGWAVGLGGDVGVEVGARVAVRRP